MGGGLSVLQRNGSQKGRDLESTPKSRLKSDDLRRSTLSQHRNSMVVPSPLKSLSDENVHLTVQQIKAIQYSWSKLNVNPKVTGTEIFIRFFKIHPYYMEYFPSFKGKNVAMLESSLMLKAHGISVMYAFSTLVDNLSDPDYFRKFMRQSVKVHHGRGISIKQYQEMLVVLIDYMEEKLADVFDTFTRIAWRRFTADFGNSVTRLRHRECLPPVSMPYDVMSARQRMWNEQ